MKNLVNIARTEEKPLYVDASSITGIWFNSEKDELTAFNEKGTLLYISAKSFDVDLPQMLQKLADAGNPLITLPVRWDDKEYTHFISPAAVTFATVTEVTKDGTLGSIIGVKGMGWEESYGTKPEELQKLLDAVKATGKTFLKYGPEQVHARWYNPAALYIDPASVTEIRDDGFQVNVRFHNSGQLDVQIGKVPDVNEIANEIWQGGKDTRSLEEIFREAHAREDKAKMDARHNFADGLAAANGTLTKVPNAKHAIHIRPENFDYIATSNDEKSGKFILSMQAQKTERNPYPEAVRVYFNSAAERAQAIEALNNPRPKAKNTAAPAP